MLHDGRIPMNDAEHEALDALEEKHKGMSLTYSRRDPGNTGPLWVQTGDDTYEVSEAGKVKKK